MVFNMRGQPVISFLDTTDEGEECQRLEWLLRFVHHTGTSVRLTHRGSEIEGNKPAPYPAFRCLWKDVLSYRWKRPQRINVLELSPFLAKLRCRTRNPAEHGHRFFCVLDSLVVFYVLSKGSSSSPRLNRLCRRIAALDIASFV